MSLFPTLIRPFQSRDLAPPKVEPATSPDETKIVTIIWGKSAGSAQLLNATFSASISSYMDKQQRERENDMGQGPNITFP